MRIPTFEALLPLSALRRELRYTLVRLEHRAWGKTWVARFAALLKEIDAAIDQDLALRDALETAEAALDEADYVLDASVLYTAKVARSELSGDALTTILKALYGSERPSDFVRPKLGEELDQVRIWPSILKDAPVAALRDLQPRIEAAIKLCDTALASHSKAASALQAFRISIHAPLVSRINGERKALGGEAEKQSHDPALNEDTASGLFRAGKRSRPARPDTVASLRGEIAEVEAMLGHLKERLAQAQSQEDAEARAEAERRGKEQLIADLERAQADMTAKLQVLRDEVKTPRKK